MVFYILTLQRRICKVCENFGEDIALVERGACADIKKTLGFFTLTLYLLKERTRRVENCLLTVFLNIKKPPNLKGFFLVLWWLLLVRFFVRSGFFVWLVGWVLAL